MKIAFVGDTHGNTIWLVEAIKVFKRAGVRWILQCGDFGIWTHQKLGVWFLDKTEEALVENDITLIFTDGNHENFDHLYKIPVDEDGFRRVRDHIWHAPRGHVWNIDGVRFGAMGGAHSIDGPGGVWNQARGPMTREMYDHHKMQHEQQHIDLGGWWPQETITHEQAQLAIMKARVEGTGQDRFVDVMISHDVPQGVTIPGIYGYPAADVNRQLLRQVVDAWCPQLMVCGHYHKRYGETIKVGPERQFETRVEILDAESNKDSHLLMETDPFTLILPEGRRAI